MSIPLDNLYDFFEGISDSNLVIYRWQQHGSKKLEDCVQHTYRPAWGTDDFIKCWTNPAIIFHDQEPLDYNLYNQDFLEKWLKSHRPNISHSRQLHSVMQHENIRAALAPNQHDQVLLVHSELGGSNLEWYANNGYVPVYVWSHALIAMDWYRYAKHDLRLHRPSQGLLFNIHARAWTGTREYRLRFLDRLAAKNLHHISRVNLGSSDGHRLVRDHDFQDSKWICDTAALAHVYATNDQLDSTASGSYDVTEYENTCLDVVLETLFEDQRIHITEKTLRCLACARPFVLLSGPGSLAYLKHYGFETFDDLWDESYDLVSDPVERMESVIDTLQQISQLDWSSIQHKVKTIARHNQQRFFSDSFFAQVVGEYQQNLQHGLQQMQSGRPGRLWQKIYNIGTGDPLVGQWFNRVVDLYEL
jgi:hypothetical protein